MKDILLLLCWCAGNAVLFLADGNGDFTKVCTTPLGSFVRVDDVEYATTYMQNSCGLAVQSPRDGAWQPLLSD